MSEVNTKLELSCKAAELYNRICDEEGIYYRKLENSEFNRIFRREGRLSVSAYCEDEFIGFLSAQLPSSKGGTAYLSYVGVDPQYRGHGAAAAMLDKAEEILRDEYEAEKIDIVFYDPAHLPWIIPGSMDGHPCAPGIKTGSDAERMLKKRGYSEWCAQIAYYLPLSLYREPDELQKNEKLLNEDGIEITLYNAEKHRELYELFDAIRNPGWRTTVFAHLERPIIVAVDRKRSGLVVGYTGPLSQDAEGGGIRGNFCGIGTHPDYRGRGIAKQIFCRMCRLHSEAGATFMSLYTGENNPARKVYETAGCRPAVRWSNLRLVLNNKQK